MIINATMRRKDSEIEVESCQVEKVITLTDDNFNYFSHHLLDGFDIFREHRDLMGFSDDGLRHCLLILSESGDDGILVDAQGSSYARYSAHIPNARQLVERDQHPYLENFNGMMKKIADNCVELSLQQHTDGDFRIPRAALPNQEESPWFQYKLLGLMLSNRPEFSSVETTGTEIHVNVAPEFCNVQISGLRELSQDDVDIMAAKHLLWIHGESGGEQADFTDCALRDLDLTAKNFNNAIMRGAVFVNCDMTKTEMTFVDGCGAKFINCEMQRAYMDEANFKGALFQKCDMYDVVSAHGNFTNATFANCDVHRMGLWNSCIENVDWSETNTSVLDTTNCSYDESDWSGQGEGMVMNT